MGWTYKPKKVFPSEGTPRQGMFHNVWENKFPFNFPLPGAQGFGYESLGLVEFTPIGAGVPLQEQIRSVNPQLYVGQAVTLAGIPTQAGQMITQPLIDPQSGYARNSVAERGSPAPNTPYPM